MDARRAALIVATSEYQDPGLRRLRAPAHDAEALARVLGDPEIGSFDVRTLLDSPEYVIREAVAEFFSERRPDDLLLLHFSCHGVKDEGGELYFATINTKLRLLGATAVAAEFVNRCMNRSRSRRVVLLLDCCYAGAFERGMVARADRGVAIEERFGGRGRAVITASTAMEYAFEGDELANAHEAGPSLFTSALVGGLESGEADRDQDGYIGLDELYEYVYDRVRESTPNQTPSKWTYGVQGELYIARRSRPVSRPGPRVLRPIQSEPMPQLTAPERASDADEVDKSEPPLERGERRSRTPTGLLFAGAALLFAPVFMPWGGTALFVLEHTGLSYQQSIVVVVALGGALLALLLTAVLPVRTALATRAGRAAAAPELERRRLRIPAGLAIAGATMLLVALFMSWGSFRSWSFQSMLLPSLVAYSVILAALVAGASGCMLICRTNWLIGTGVLLGAVAASIWGLLLAPTVLLPTSQTHGGSVGAGLWLAAHLILALAACVAGLAVARTTAVRIVLHPPDSAHAWLVVLLGLAGAVTFFVAQVAAVPHAAAMLGVESRSLLAGLWPVVMALLVPICSVLAAPRRFGVALLCGWIGGGTALFFFELFGFFDTTGPALLAFGVTLLALLLVAVQFGRAPTSHLVRQRRV